MPALRLLRLLPLCLALPLGAQPSAQALIVEESRVPPHTLPDLLRTPSGQAITTAQAWQQDARPALLDLFESHVYSRTPRVPVIFTSPESAQSTGSAAPSAPTDAIHVHVTDLVTTEILGGKALLHQARLRFERGERSASFDVLLARPARVTAPVPAIVGLNFWGNHTIADEPAIRLAPTVPGMEPKERGSYARRWPLEELIDRGYALATAFRGEIAPDKGAHYTIGVLALFPENTGDNRMGAIGAWAWALSRLADYLGTLPEIDSSRLTVVGHSRLAKSALWAAAQDTRFSAVFANASGCMGAALSRRQFGETVEIITRNFPYWFSPRLPAYADRINELPLDQHQLLALIAPRPLHLGSAEQDLWADPRGELLALREAAKIYALHGINAVVPDELPAADATPIGQVLRFHRRTGKHDILPADWNAFFRAPTPIPGRAP